MVFKMPGLPDCRDRPPPAQPRLRAGGCHAQDQPRSGRGRAPRDNHWADVRAQEEVHARTALGPSARPGLPGRRLPAVRCGCGRSLLDSGRMAARQTNGAATWEVAAVSEGNAHRVREQPAAPLAREGVSDHQRPLGRDRDGALKRLIGTTSIPVTERIASPRRLMEDPPAHKS